jgi:hypothetical protein
VQRHWRWERRSLGVGDGLLTDEGEGRRDMEGQGFLTGLGLFGPLF